MTGTALAPRPGPGAAAGRTTDDGAAPPGAGTPGAALVVPCAVTAAVLVCLPWALDVPGTALGVLTLAVVATCAGGAAGAVAGGTRPMALLFWVFTGSWLGLGSLYQLSHGQVAWGDSPLLLDRSRLLAAQALTLACLLAFAVGGHVQRRRAATRRTRPGAHGADPRPAGGSPTRGTLLVACGALAAGGALLPLVTASAGGLAGLFTTRLQRAEAIASAGATTGAADGLLRILPAALALVACYAALTVLRREGLGRSVRAALGSAPDAARHRATVAVAVAVGGLALLAVYSNPFTTSRFISAAAAGALCLVALRPRSVHAGAVLALVSTAGLLLVYPLAYALRGLPSNADPDASAWSVLATNDFDGFQQVVNTLQLVQEHGHPWGSHLVSALLFAVPRSIWDGKAQVAAIDVAANRGYTFTDLSMPLHAELFLDTGLAGALVLMLGLGYLWSRLDHAWLTAPGSSAALLVPYLCLGQLGLLRGPLGSLVPVVLTVSVLLLLAFGGAARTWRLVAGAPASRR